MEQAEQRIEYVPVDKLLFDVNNPRLPRGVDGSDDSQLIPWMLADGTITEVMESIAEKGYFAGEPMLVVPAEDPEYMVVIEGNRRLTALKLLLNPDLATSRRNKVARIADSCKVPIDEVPILKYDSRNEVLDYLGFRHITGVKEWSSLAKARYLNQLQRNVKDLDRQEQFRSLARTIGSTSNYVARLLAALKVYEKLEDEDYFGIKRDRDDPVDFSVLATALTYTNIAKFIGIEELRDINTNDLDAEHLREFTQWTFESTGGNKPRVRESRHLSDLNAVIKEEDALDAFREGESLDNALLRTGVPAESLKQAIEDARARLRIAYNLLARVQTVSDSNLDRIQEVRRLAGDLESSIKGRLSEEDS